MKFADNGSTQSESEATDKLYQALLKGYHDQGVGSLAEEEENRSGALMRRYHSLFVVSVDLRGAGARAHEIASRVICKFYQTGS